MRTHGWKIVLLLASVALADRSPFKEGKWQITVQMEMPGMPMAMPPMTTTQCLTKKDMVPRDPQHSKDCQVVDMKASGGKVSWKMRCTGRRPVEATGEGTYEGDTFHGQMTMRMSDPRSGRPMEMKQTMSGRWLGACDSK